MLRSRSNVARIPDALFSSPCNCDFSNRCTPISVRRCCKRLLTSGGISEASRLAALSISVTALPARQKSIASSVPINPPPTISTRWASRSCVSQARYSCWLFNVSINSRPAIGGTKAAAPVASTSLSYCHCLSWLFTTWASASMSVTQVWGKRRRANCSANSPAD
ncbi:hypothetical protein SDC9_166805 [bioreactor metagenome]|uniref:Uncharacterized protein n=1 Tax=bioreactor metagenome TaxID=1076179 RepID=A0A645FZV2_9ZZZZ